MRMRSAVLCLLLGLPLAAQEKKEETKQPPVPNPTNLKILKATTGKEIAQIMRSFTAGLGVQCTYCHVQGNFASDENPKKEVARKMIRMAQRINAEFPDGKLRVSCYTCHRGDVEPKTRSEEHT